VRWAKVVEDDHPVFSGRPGPQTLRVYTRLSRWANTSKGTAKRPLGHVIAGEKRLADDLQLTDQTVRHHLRRLIHVELVVVWEPPQRGRIRPLGDGRWGGLATEYLVVRLATDEGLAAAKLRAESRAARAERRSQDRPGLVVRGDDGRFRRAVPRAFSTPDRGSAGTPAAVATGSPASVATAVGEPAFETLDVETLDVETKTQGSADALSSRFSSNYTNRAAWRALEAAEEQWGWDLGYRERGGLAHVLMDYAASLCEAGDVNATHELADLASDIVRSLSEGGADSAHEAACDVLGIGPTEYWETVALGSAARDHQPHPAHIARVGIIEEQARQ
jgi:microcompartment protein CcmK/EutM